MDTLDAGTKESDSVLSSESSDVISTTKKKSTNKRKPRKKKNSDDESEDSEDWEPHFANKAPKPRQKKERVEEPKPRKSRPIDESKLTLRLHVRKTIKEMKEAGQLAVSVHEVWEKVKQHPEFTHVKHSSMCPLFYGTIPSRDFVKVARKKDTNHLLYALREGYDAEKVKEYLDKVHPGYCEPFEFQDFILSIKQRKPQTDETITLLQENDTVPPEFIPRSDQQSFVPTTETLPSPKPLETRSKKEKEEQEGGESQVSEDEEYAGSDDESGDEDVDWEKKKISKKSSGELLPILKIMREMKEHGLEAALPYQIEHMLKDALGVSKIPFSVAYRIYQDSESKFSSPLFIKVALLESPQEHSILYAIRKGLEPKKVKQFLATNYGYKERERKGRILSKSPRQKPITIAKVETPVQRENYKMRPRKQEKMMDENEEETEEREEIQEFEIVKEKKQKIASPPSLDGKEKKAIVASPPLLEDTSPNLSDFDLKQRAEVTAQWAVKLLNALKEESIPAALIHELLPLMQEFYDANVQAEEVINCVAHRKEFVRIALVKSYVTDTPSFVYAVKEGLDIKAIKAYLTQQYGEFTIVDPQYEKPEPETSHEAQGDGSAATSSVNSS